jgi:hypothetical protein
MGYLTTGATGSTSSTATTYLTIAAKQRNEYLGRNGYAIDFGNGIRYPNMTFAEARALRSYWIEAWQKHYKRNWQDVSWGSGEGNYQAREYFTLLYSLEANPPANPTALMRPADTELSIQWVPVDRIRRFWDQVRSMASDLSSQGFVPSPWDLALEAVSETIDKYTSAMKDFAWNSVPAWAKWGGAAMLGLYVVNTFRRR